MGARLQHVTLDPALQDPPPPNSTVQLVLLSQDDALPCCQLGSFPQERTRCSSARPCQATQQPLNKLHAEHTTPGALETDHLCPVLTTTCRWLHHFRVVHHASTLTIASTLGRAEALSAMYNSTLLHLPLFDEALNSTIPHKKSLKQAL